MNFINIIIDTSILGKANNKLYVIFTFLLLSSFVSLKRLSLYLSSLINTPLDYIESVTFKTIINYGNTEYLKDYCNDRVNRTLDVVLKN